jgi:tight adherence protein C
MEILLAAIIGIGLVVAGFLILILSLRWLRKDDVTQRVREFVVRERGGQARWDTAVAARRMELRGSFADRTVFAFTRRMGRAISSMMPAQAMEELEHRLALAGNPYRLRARDFIGIRILLIILAGVIAYILLRQQISTLYIAASTGGFLALYLLPIVWLQRKMRTRQEEISKELPNVIDMLSICTTAGLSFDQSLQRVSEQWETSIGDELGRVVSEMEMGLARSEALRNLAERLKINELSSFVAIVIQSEQLGMSVSDTLHGIAEQMRIEWRFSMQEEARKLSTKILIPLVFFIFPAMLAIILGPSIPALLDLFDYVQ